MWKSEQRVKWVSFSVCAPPLLKNPESLHQALISYACTYSKNIQIIEPFAVITVYKASGRWKGPVFVWHEGGESRDLMGYKGERGGNEQAFFSWTGNKTLKKRERHSEETGRHFESLYKCSSRGSTTTTPLLHHPCNHFQHIKFGLTTIAELQY